jgi:hypothetical protein
MGGRYEIKISVKHTVLCCCKTGMRSFTKVFISINYHVTSPILLIWQGIYEKKRREGFIICERSSIIMKLLWRSYLV